jgi:hypothetical protein
MFPQRHWKRFAITQESAVPFSSRSWRSWRDPPVGTAMQLAANPARPTTRNACEIAGNEVYSPPQVLQIVGRLCHLVLAFPYVGDLANGRATSLHGHYCTSSLLRTQPPPSRLWPTSRFRRLYGLPCSDDFAPGRGGLLQLLSMSLSPCCRFNPAEVNIRIGQSSAAHAAFALRPSGILLFEATTRLPLLRPGDRSISA